MVGREINALWDWAWEKIESLHLSYGSTAFLLFLIRRARFSPEGCEIVIGRREIVDLFGGSALTVMKHREVLRECGVIEYELQRGLPCKYILCVPKDFIALRSMPHPLREKAEELHVVTSNKELKTPLSKTTPKPESSTENVAKVNVKVPEGDKKEKVEKVPKQHSKRSGVLKGITRPNLEEFMDYARTLEGYSKEMDTQLKGKYGQWDANDWVNGFGRPIRSWKAALLSSWAYMKNGALNTVLPVSGEAPRIRRPKQTYNE